MSHVPGLEGFLFVIYIGALAMTVVPEFSQTNKKQKKQNNNNKTVNESAIMPSMFTVVSWLPVPLV